MRTNPIGSRLRYGLNWPSNVFHPTLTSYLTHCFQSSLTSIGLRSSLSKVWVNLTIYCPIESPLGSHPMAKAGQFEYKLAQGVLGRMERAATKLNRKRAFVAPIKLLSSSRNESIYRKGPITLRINSISNPLLNGDICAQYVAKRLETGLSLPVVFRDLLQGISSSSSSHSNRP